MRDIEPLANDLRALIELVVSTMPSDEALAVAREAVGRALAALRPFAAGGPPQRFAAALDDARLGDLMPYDPIVGRLSPLAPLVTFAWEHGRSIGRVRYTAPYEGPPGCVHGGVIAGMFDQVLSMANLMQGAAGPTVRLALRFRRPTPLGADLVFEGWQERAESRRVYTRGQLRHGDVVTVEAEGVFAPVPVDRVMKLLE